MKKKIPYFARRRISCPDCGLIIPEVDAEYIGDFTCPRCKVEYNNHDFWEEQYYKYSKEADLSGESNNL